MQNNKIKYLIAGPCSAETEKQVLNTAKELKAIKELSFFRAGVWKPRTNPNSFEGVGDIGLKWLKEVKEQHQLKVITEVATPKQVELCLEHNIDALWIGTRTTVNPFYVQEIANAVKGTNVPIFVKNPITPDLKLWLGAIERFKNAGINNVIAVHRGFFSHQKSIYRNEPIWEIPLTLKKEHPEIDLICDPSHIAGNKELIVEVAKNAIYYGMEGLMIESHLSPQKALSDREQQITPAELQVLLSSLSFIKSKENINSLELKNELNKLESETLILLTKRYQLLKKLTATNSEKTNTLYKFEEWKKLLKDLKNDSKELNLNHSFINKVIEIIFNDL